MITADEAYKQTVQNLDPISTIDEFLEIETGIKAAIEKKFFVLVSKPLPFNVGEKLGVELEEFGYSTTVTNSPCRTQEGEPLCQVVVSWRHKPAVTSRVEQMSKN